MSNKLKNIGFIWHIPSGGITNAERILIEQSAKNDLGLIIVDETLRGINISDLTEMKVKETQQLVYYINRTQ